MPSSSEKGCSKRKKCASSGEVEFEDSSKKISTKNDGKNKDSKERCKSMSPRRNSWREDIKKIKGWREELKDRLKRRGKSLKQSKVLCDRVTKRSSRLSWMRTLRCERVPSKQSSRVKLMKNGSSKRDTQMKKCEKSGSSIRPLHPEGEVLREEGKFKIINDVERSMGMDENVGMKEKKIALEEIIHQQGTNGDVAKQDSSSSSQRSKHWNEDDDAGAMARNISLLELKMEVFTTRLKELEWEREQLRKERESFQAGFPELSSKRMSKPKEKEEDLFSMDEGGLRNKKK